MHYSKRLLFSLIIIPAILAFPRVVKAFPPLPSSFYGVVKLNNNNLPDGTTVEAIINDQVVASAYTQTYKGESVYAIDVPGDDSSTTLVEGGVEGDIIHFKVGGIEVDDTGIWHSGTNVELALILTSTSKLEPPQATLTPLPTQTAIIVAQKSPTPEVTNAATSSMMETSSAENTVSADTGNGTEGPITDGQTVSDEDVQPTGMVTEMVQPDQAAKTQQWESVVLIIVGILVMTSAVWLVSRKYWLKKK